jgi:hypothetical protein
MRSHRDHRGNGKRQQALNVPPAIAAKLGMNLGELEWLHRGLATLNDAARRANVKPLAAPAKDSI